MDAVKLHEIVDGHLYQRGRTDELNRDVKLAVLEENDIDYVINLWSRRDADLVDVPGLTYVTYGIPDGTDLSATQLQLLDSLAKGAAAHINRTGKAVLSQCHAGRNRSGFMSALIVRELMGCSGAAALAHVRARRPGAVDNALFAQILEQLG